MEDDGFKIVRSRRGKSRLKKLGYEPSQRIVGSLEDIRLAIEKAYLQMKESGLSSWIIGKLKYILETRTLSHVYVVGNGHFDALWEPGVHQLALIREICGEFCAEMIFQEPCISSAERQWLFEQKKTVIRDASDVSIGAVVENENCVCLVVLIHGLHSLLNDLLTSCWQSHLNNLIIICNDYRSSVFIDEVFVESNFGAIISYCKIANFVNLPDYTPHPSFFLNSSLVYINKDVVLPDLRMIKR